MESVYLNHDESVWNLEDYLTKWVDFYWWQRRYSALGDRRRYTLRSKPNVLAGEKALIKTESPIVIAGRFTIIEKVG